ncbi:MAG: carbohydrate ABC transporter permease [Candidatus Latescibacteria bacterium]|nr:carbohydrate ABC transporter permease [Candidatus Latescibacterota bacterium]
MGQQNVLNRLFSFLGLSAFLVFVTFPIYRMLVTSITPEQELFNWPIRYIPTNTTLEHYAVTLLRSDIPSYFANSLTVASVASACTLVVSVFGGYALARYHFRGKQPTVLLFLATQMMPIVVLIVPLFVVFRTLGLLNTLYSLMIVYTVLNIPFCTMMMQGFFSGIPAELEEAAMVDGCTRFGAIARVAVPLTRPGLIATFLFAFIGAWNELLFAVMFLNTDGMFTLPVGLYMFISKYDIHWGRMMAGATIALIPALAVFGFVQRYMVKGMSLGAVKG